ncbi:hypothetical protein [Roseicyclus mahoneyensis]|uniref:Uncharacterized protein n=1 Tax=Roseicyclus mahoneyensis TaxID=164332 RepID=A0A316GIT8_9RHOB|nr:hypothetical protein [Roseicyclus mahoneyensis]PWK60444.1 hypothetical protein C7455_10480 [Roseicyclus mahoneyensis]
MSNPDPDRDQSHIHRVLEAILLSPVTGRAVARTLLSQATERETPTIVSDIRAHRADKAAGKDAEARHGADASRGPTSPWARSG